MVKFGKKFFFEDGKSQPIKKTTRKKETKIKEKSLILEKIKFYSKKMIPVVLILILVFGIILLTKSCNSKKKTSKNNNNKAEDKLAPKIVDTIKIKINEQVPTIDKFVKNYDKVKTETDSITYDTSNFVNNAYTAVGEYKVIITINGINYSSRLIVKDTEAPEYSLKDVTITEGQSYSLNDFVVSCIDNSGKECALDYANMDYGRYTNPGTYEIKIVAKDLSGNKADVKSAKLIINAKQNTKPNNGGGNNKPSTQTCDYGSAEPANNQILAYSVAKNGCAIDPEYAKTGTYITVPNKAARNDLEQLKKDIENKNITATIKFELNVEPVFNKAGTGLVGYKAYIIGHKCLKESCDIAKSGDTELIIKYYLNQNGKRQFEVNKLGL